MEQINRTKIPSEVGFRGDLLFCPTYSHPKSSSRVILKSLAMGTSSDISGYAISRSHLLTACILTFRWYASCRCVIPSATLSRRMFCPMGGRYGSAPLHRITFSPRRFASHEFMCPFASKLIISAPAATGICALSSATVRQIDSLFTLTTSCDVVAAHRDLYDRGVPDYRSSLTR